RASLDLASRMTVDAASSASLQTAPATVLATAGETCAPSIATATMVVALGRPSFCRHCRLRWLAGREFNNRDAVVILRFDLARFVLKSLLNQTGNRDIIDISYFAMETERLWLLCCY